MARIRELQALLGLNLDEIAVVLRNEDRLAQIRLSYHDERTSDSERRKLTRECLTLQESLRATVEAKRTALEGFLADVDARIRKCRVLLASAPEPEPGQDGRPRGRTRRVARSGSPRAGTGRAGSQAGDRAACAAQPAAPPGSRSHDQPAWPGS